MSQLSLIDEKFVRSALRYMINAATNIPEENVIKAADNRQTSNNPAGTLPYCTVELDEAKPYGKPGIKEVSNETTGLLDTQIKQSYELPIRLNFYRVGAFGAASSMMEMNFIPQVTTFLVQNNIGITVASKPRKRPYLLNGKMNQKAIVDLTLSFETLRVIETNPIHNVSVTINIVDDENSIEFTAPEQTNEVKQ